MPAPTYLQADRERETGEFIIDSSKADRVFYLPATPEGIAVEVVSTVPFHVGAFGLPGFALRRPALVPFRLYIAAAKRSAQGYHLRAADPAVGEPPVVGHFQFRNMDGSFPAGFLFAVR